MTGVHARVAQRYRAVRDGQQFGPWEPGASVDLDAADLEWVNRDAPGTLQPQPATEPHQATAAAATPREPARPQRTPRRPGGEE